MIRIAQTNLSLSNERLLLRQFTEDDWLGVHRYASQEIVCRYQAWGPNTEEDSIGFVKQVIKDASQQPRKRFAFAIVTKNNEQMIGAGELTIRDLSNRNGEIAYIVNPEYWGRGIATDVATLLIDFGFTKLNLHRIFATCDPRNIGSSNVLEKVGMTLEGRIREDLFIKDGWRDSLLYSVLEHEWEASSRLNRFSGG